LPAPGPGIDIAEVPEREVAAIKFRGRPTDRLLAAKEEALRTWIGKQGRAASGGAEQAYHNSPLRPGPIRQNEVLVPLK